MCFCQFPETAKDGFVASSVKGLFAEERAFHALDDASWMNAVLPHFYHILSPRMFLHLFLDTLSFFPSVLVSIYLML